MTKAINESYSSIVNAPLRYFADAFRPSYAAATVRPVTRPMPEPASPNVASGRAQKVGEYPRVESIQKYTWAEFWIRFVCGGIFGAMCGFRTGVRYYISSLCRGNTCWVDHRSVGGSRCGRWILAMVPGPMVDLAVTSRARGSAHRIDSRVPHTFLSDCSSRKNICCVGRRNTVHFVLPARPA